MSAVPTIHMCDCNAPAIGQRVHAFERSFIVYKCPSSVRPCGYRRVSDNAPPMPLCACVIPREMRLSADCQRFECYGECGARFAVADPQLVWGGPQPRNDGFDSDHNRSSQPCAQRPPFFEPLDFVHDGEVIGAAAAATATAAAVGAPAAAAAAAGTKRGRQPDTDDNLTDVEFRDLMKMCLTHAERIRSLVGRVDRLEIAWAEAAAAEATPRAQTEAAAAAAAAASDAAPLPSDTNDRRKNIRAFHEKFKVKKRAPWSGGVAAVDDESELKETQRKRSRTVSAEEDRY